MKTVELDTDNPALRLVAPDIERDAALGVQWLEGELGRSTLKLMGVPDNDNVPTTLEAERERVRDFIEGEDQLNWMIEYDGKVVGSVWVDMKQKESVLAPSIHVMIGDPAMRGKGVGYASISSVLQYLKSQGHDTIYSRHLTKNTGAQSLLTSLGFKPDGSPYTDQDGLEWQNVLKTDHDTS